MAPEGDHDEDETGYGVDRRSFLGAGAAAGAMAVVGTDIATAATTPANTVSLIHDTHFHGRFSGGSGVNIAQYTHEVNRLRGELPNAGFVGIGDDFSPSTMGFEFHGEHMVEALNYLDPVVDGVGNHEFDFGLDNAVTQFQASEFPWVVANLLTPDGDPIPGTERWTLESVGDHTVGFFGSGVGDFHSITAYPPDYQALDPVAAAAEATTALQDAGADVVVMASHTSSETHDEIAAGVDGLDAVVGSHSGTVQEAVREVSGTLISEVGDQFGWLGVLQLDATTGDVVDWRRLDLAAQADSLPEDDGMAAIMDKWEAKLQERLGETVFRTTNELDATSANYADETNVGTLASDIMRDVMDADVGYQNPGGVRSGTTYGPGPITGADVYNIFPFPNKVVKVEISGADLKYGLEYGISALPWSFFGMQAGAQVSGVQYEYQGHDGDQEIRSFYVGGDELEEDETYTLATIDFVYENYAGFGEGELLEATEDFEGTVFIDYLQGQVVDADTDHQILRVDEDVGEVALEIGDDTVTAVLDHPDTIDRVHPRTFDAVTQYGHTIEAAGTTVRDDGIAVTFDAQDLATLASGPRDHDLRVRGGFEPDDAAYGYETEDGDLLDLPASPAAYYYTVTGTIPIPGSGVRSWIGGEGRGR